MVHRRFEIAIVVIAIGLICQDIANAQPKEFARKEASITQSQKMIESDAIFLGRAKWCWYFSIGAMWWLALLTSVLSRRVWKRKERMDFSRRDFIVVGTPVLVMLSVPFVALFVTHGYWTRVHSEVAKETLHSGLLFWTVLSALAFVAWLWASARMGRTLGAREKGGAGDTMQDGTKE